MMAQEPLMLRPMTVSDIIDASIRIYRQNFTPILGISAIVQLPIMLISIGASIAWMRMGMMGPNPEEIQFGPEFLMNSGAMLVALVASALLYPLGEAALAIGISERYLGREIKVGDCYRAAMPFWARVMWTTIIYWLACYAVLIGGLVLVGIFLMVGLAIRYALGPAVIVVVEGRSGGDALARSWSLTKDYFWQVFAVMAVLFMIVSVISGGLSMPAQGAAAYLQLQENQYAMLAQVASQVVVSVISLILRPVWMIGTVLVYYDLRIRKEGFDLMMMAEALGRPGPSPEIERQHLYPPGELAPPPPPPGTAQKPYAPAADSPLFPTAVDSSDAKARDGQPPSGPSQDDGT